MTASRVIFRSALAALSIVLGFAAWNNTTAPIDLPVAPNGRPFGTSEPQAADQLGHAPVAYSAIVERPLFHWARRPLPARQKPDTTSPPQATEVAPPAVVMRGVIVAAGQRRAILERAGDADYVRLSEGDTIEGWTVVKIEATSALLKRADRELTVTLAPPPEHPEQGQ